ncbi:MAG: hypothetical protein ACI9SJ_000866 [Flavobacteriaceae bacterium]|jgi:hypothetical protein
MLISTWRIIIIIAPIMMMVNKINLNAFGIERVIPFTYIFKKK